MSYFYFKKRFLVFIGKIGSTTFLVKGTHTKVKRHVQALQVLNNIEFPDIELKRN
jgi:hypothetical protein